MVEISAFSTVVIDAPPERVLAAVADYVTVRPKILTSHHSGYRVLAGEQGAGTVATWKLQATKLRLVDVKVTVHVAGLTVSEKDPNLSMITNWTITPSGAASSVTVKPAWQGSGGVRSLNRWRSQGRVDGDPGRPSGSAKSDGLAHGRQHRGQRRARLAAAWFQPARRETGCERRLPKLTTQFQREAAPATRGSSTRPCGALRHQRCFSRSSRAARDLREAVILLAGTTIKGHRRDGEPWVRAAMFSTLDAARDRAARSPMERGSHDRAGRPRYQGPAARAAV
jgi:Polyketide cyclase / dehydrase and lipid transport